VTWHGGSRRALAGLVLAGVAALALLGRSERRERLDERVSRLAQRLPEQPAVRVSAAVGRMPHQALSAGVVTAAALVLLARSRPREASRLVLAAAQSAAGSVGLKRLLRRPRPPAELRLGPVQTSWRFPSGHATSAAIAALAVSRALEGAGPARGFGTALAAAVALGVGGSRVHLAEHYASDVLAGYGIVLAAGLAVPPRPAAGG
jgi:undecaprenyl-diphosphatase